MSFIPILQPFPDHFILWESVMPPIEEEDEDEKGEEEEEDYPPYY